MGRWTDCPKDERKNRRAEYSWGQFDVLIDIVSYGVTPAVVLLSYGKFEPIFLLGSFLIVAGTAIRLSYFSTFGFAGGKHYTVLALDNNNIILVFLFLFAGVFNEGTFAIILYVSCLGLTALNVSQLKPQNFLEIQEMFSFLPSIH